MSEEGKTTKKRTRYTSHACDFCKQRHLRCDGNQVCEQCAKRNKVCTYTQKNIKRGPKPTGERISKKRRSRSAKAIVPDQAYQPKKEKKSDQVSTDSILVLENQLNEYKYMLLESDRKYQELYTHAHNIPFGIPASIEFDPLPSVSDVTLAVTKFLENVHPIVPNNFVLSPSVAWEVTQWISSKVEENVTLEKITINLTYAIALAHGFRFLKDENTSSSFAHHAKTICRHLFFSYTKLVPEIFASHADKLVSCLYLLSTYEMQSAKFNSARTYISQAYNILNMHVNEITPMVSHRLYAHLAGMSRSTNDMSHWVDNAHLLGTEACSPINRVLLALFYCSPSMLRDPKNEPLPAAILVPLDSKYLPDKDLILYQHMIHELEDTEEYIWNYQKTFPNGPISDNYYHSFTMIVEGCRSLVLAQLGCKEPAKIACQKVMDIAKIIRGSVIYFPLVLGLSYALQVCKTYEFTELYHQGRQVMDNHYSNIYPVVEKIKSILANTETVSHTGSVKEEQSPIQHYQQNPMQFAYHLPIVPNAQNVPNMFYPQMVLGNMYANV
eukprot:TRINITY_DN3040_c0_g1_i1.p1 TRINITY_DN3040_c0_g1~~TRINITY_DN3040_c0_g1_i1.p1  ORF type:complete len:554 (-),score=86.20 TRINITY_DN3040_c0_g1_i1:168-1829(-)